MADLVVIVPSRGRPQNIGRLVDAWLDTTLADTDLVVAVDEDDPQLDEYQAVRLPFAGTLRIGQRQRLGGTLNAAVQEVLDGYYGEPPTAVGFMGDDHLPRTEGWDSMLVDALTQVGSGIVYGDDLLQGERLPTAAFMTADIVRTLGWMVPPGLVHLYIDDAWRELGRAMGRLRYLPQVVIEHLHPAAGKAQMDDRYREVNAPEVDAADKARFVEWFRGELPGNVETLRKAGIC